jgi:hypothetical protein
MVAAALFLAAVAVGTTGCSGQAGTPLVRSVSTTVPSVSATGPVQPPASPSASSPGPVTIALARSAPVRLQISAIGVDSTLMPLGLRADGSMEVPAGGFPAGWYTGAPTPGELGPAIIAGHVDMRGPGVFFALHNLKPGDLVTITRADGTRPAFRITRVEAFPKDTFPTKQVFGNINHAGLRLITCGGTFNSGSGHYEDNIVAFADLVAPGR